MRADKECLSFFVTCGTFPPVQKSQKHVFPTYTGYMKHKTNGVNKGGKNNVRKDQKN